MKDHTLVERAGFYRTAFPKYRSLQADDRWLDGVWVMGNNYRGTSYYGSYPPQFLRRVMSLFPDADRVLQLFSGSLPYSEKYCRFDIKPEYADLVGDAETLSDVVVPGLFDLIIADPPYSIEDAMHYGTCMVNRNKVLLECKKVLRVGGYIVWLDQVLPMYRKDELYLCGLIGMVRSTNHRFRLISIFKKH